MIQEAYVQGLSTCSVDDLVKAMGMTGVSKSQVSPQRRRTWLFDIPPTPRPGDVPGSAPDHGSGLRSP
ncbi:MAG: hypothetical protein Kow0058_15610 [Roseovarius sp.]